MNRRELMKYFAAGTVIAPLAGKLPAAILLETPKIELAQTPKIIKPFALKLALVKSVTITFLLANGDTHSIEGHLEKCNGVINNTTEVRVPFDFLEDMDDLSPGTTQRHGWGEIRGMLK